MSYYCLLDFKATCWKDMKGKRHEIIEFPFILWHFGHGHFTRIADFREYVKHIKLLFCRELIGIIQDQVDNTKYLEDVIGILGLKIASLYTGWIDLKKIKKFYNYQGDLGLNGMLTFLGMEFEGRSHAGFDGCHNTSRILQKLIQYGYNLVEKLFSLKFQRKRPVITPC